MKPGVTQLVKTQTLRYFWLSVRHVQSRFFPHARCVMSSHHIHSVESATLPFLKQSHAAPPSQAHRRPRRRMWSQLTPSCIVAPVAFAHRRFGQMISQLVTGKRRGSCLVKQWLLCANTPPPLARQGTRRGRTVQKGKWRVAEGGGGGCQLHWNVHIQRLRVWHFGTPPPPSPLLHNSRPVRSFSQDPL